MSKNKSKEIAEASAKATRERKANRIVLVGDGEVRIDVDFKDGGNVSVSLPSSLVLEFAGRGLNALVGDLLNKSATVEDAKKAVSNAFAAIGNGELPVRERSATAKIHPVVAAVAAVNGVSVEKAAAWYGKLDRTGKAQVRADSRIKAHLAGTSQVTHGFDGLSDEL